MAQRKARTWATTIALTSTIALSTASAAAFTPAAASAAPETATVAAEQQATATSTRGEDLTHEYRSPDGAFTVRYPEGWSATTEGGYLNLVSPDGRISGTVSTTDVLAPTPDWFTQRTVPHGSWEATELGRQLNTQTSAYSAYDPSDAEPRRDTALWGLTQVNASGMVGLPGEPHRELWAAFRMHSVNQAGAPVDDATARRVMSELDAGEDAATVRAILQSVRVG